MIDLKSQEPVQEVKRWWIVVDDGKLPYRADITISGRELRMNNTPETKELLAARFDAAVRILREEFLKRA